MIKYIFIRVTNNIIKIKNVNINKGENIENYKKILQLSKTIFKMDYINYTSDDFRKCIISIKTSYSKDNN